jgi:hypothetical protein
LVVAAGGRQQQRQLGRVVERIGKESERLSLPGAVVDGIGAGVAELNAVLL